MLATSLRSSTFIDTAINNELRQASILSLYVCNEQCISNKPEFSARNKSFTATKEHTIESFQRENCASVGPFPTSNIPRPISRFH